MFTIRHTIVASRMIVPIKHEKPLDKTSSTEWISTDIRVLQLLKKIRESTFVKSDELRELDSLIQQEGKRMNEQKDNLFPL